MTGARRSLMAVAAIVPACWLGGFLWFLNVTRHRPDTFLPPHTDGIVALTQETLNFGHITLHKVVNILAGDAIFFCLEQPVDGPTHNISKLRIGFWRKRSEWFLADCDVENAVRAWVR